MSGFTCSKASQPLLYKTDSLLKYRAIWSTDSHSSLADIPSTSVELISYPATHSCSTSFIPSLFAFQEDSLQMCFHFLSEAECSPRCFQGPSLGDLNYWMVNSNFGTWTCFFANIFQVRNGVLDILSCWFHPHGNDQYEQELNRFLLEVLFDPLLSSLDAT